jgi:glucose dehydrogenase
METRANALLTKTLLFVAQGGGNVGAAPPPGGTAQPPPETRKLHVFDKDTGAHLRAFEPPIPGPMATPMTYLHRGRQYVVIAVGAGVNAGLVAYAVPE